MTDTNWRSAVVCALAHTGILSLAPIIVNVLLFSIAENPKSTDICWIIGDNFTAKSYRNHFRKDSSDKSFIKDNYDYTAFCNSRFSSTNTNMLARLQNSLVSGFNQTKNGAILPKCILIVLDDDLITFLDFDKEGTTTLLGTWVEWLAKAFTVAINERLQQLPDRCKKEQNKPFLYWVSAPTHSYFSKARNSLRIKFNLSLESVMKTFDNMRAIKIKEHWDSRDSTLVINDKITEFGMTSYWRAVDATFRFNVLRRESYITKNLAVKNNPMSSNVPQDQESVTNSVTRPQFRDQHQDPMNNFFRRHRNYDYEGRFTNVREDQHRRHNNNRFLLPRVRGRYF